MSNDFSGLKILVVDDTESNIDILVETLGNLYDLCIALDGPGAVGSRG